jgi:predicted TIM-barrel fold metal-dependent hydrolase
MQPRNRTPIIDADSHFMEVHDSWTQYLDRRFWDRRFDVVEDRDGLTWLTVGERKINTIGRMDPGTIAEEGQAAAAARAQGKVTQGRAHDAGSGPTYMEALQPGAYRPGARLAMLDAYGIDKQIIFPTHGLVLTKQLWDDIPALCANLSAYNRWVADFNRHAPERLFGVGQLTLEDPDWAAAEVRRCAAEGIRAIVVPPASTTRDVPIFDARHDPVWTAFVDSGVALCFHIQSHKRPFTPEWYSGDDAVHHKVMDLVFMHLPVAATLTGLIVHGKLEQFAQLRIGVMELTGRWVAEWLKVLDTNVTYHAVIGGGGMPKLSMMPSEYFHRQVHVAPFAWERVGDCIERAGRGTYMFFSDWPHPEGLKDPVADYERLLGDVDADVHAAVMGRNCAALLGLR